MPRRLSLTGQLLALQVVIICVVLVGVAAVTVAQSTKRAQDVEGRRALAVAETVANTRAVRDAVQRGGLTYVRVAAENSRSVSGSGSVVVADAHGTVLASADPDELRRPFALGESTVLQGRSWVGEGRLEGDRAAVAMAPMFGRESGELIGFVAVERAAAVPVARPRTRRRKRTPRAVVRWLGMAPVRARRGAP